MSHPYSDRTGKASGETSDRGRFWRRSSGASPCPRADAGKRPYGRDPALAARDRCVVELRHAGRVFEADTWLLIKSRTSLRAI